MTYDNVEDVQGNDVEDDDNDDDNNAPKGNDNDDYV